jgi:hypothetical protein
MEDIEDRLFKLALHSSSSLSCPICKEEKSIDRIFCNDCWEKYKGRWPRIVSKARRRRTMIQKMKGNRFG